ncbi:hypothetical protein F4827_001802 [Paraburkholderia bannensis]|uniref:Lipoprotein n=1 Tax=Paraburkholderia bannensis TaxID=765414 RepID=A0A7W9WRY3_9BURK|nr:MULTISPECIES: hypothetical protein [Paraburkholderia]MBB3257000.1 hypothetical protein [Paraburkholderia sp. WP4_3_2]MBB6101954.1 hypothetical protein [Paraburkholderia bannensis]
MNRKRVTFLMSIFSFTALAGCHPFPHIAIDYSSLGQTRFDKELMTHWQTGAEPLRRDLQEIVDARGVQGAGISVEDLEALGAHCLPGPQGLCQYTGVIRYRLYGLPDSSKDDRATTLVFQINIQRQAGSATVTVETEEVE